MGTILNNYEKKMEKELSRLQYIFSEKSYTRQEQFYKAFQSTEKNITSLVFYNDSLLFWSSNKFSELNSESILFADGNVVQTANGWYYIKARAVDDFLLATLLLIKNDFVYENEFLSNQLNPIFGAKNINVYVSQSKDEHNIYDKSGDFLFSLHFSGLDDMGTDRQNTLFVIHVLIVILFLAFVVKMGLIWARKVQPMIVWLLLSLALVLLRLVTFYYKIPQFFYDTYFFTPKFFSASIWLPTLGDLLLNVVFLFTILFLGFKLTASQQFSNKLKKWQQLSWFVFYTILSVLLFVLSFSILKSLIINSNIYFLFNNFYDFSFNSFVGLITVGSLFFLFHLFASQMLLMASLIIRKALLWPLLLVLSVVVYLILLNFALALLFFVYLFVLCWYLRKEKTANQMAVMFVSLLALSIAATSCVYKNALEKEKNKRQLLALNLAADADPIAEFLFLEMEGNILNDTLLRAYLLDYIDNEEHINQHIKDNYFSDFWNKYEMQLTVCASDEKIVLWPDNIEVFCIDFFKDMIANYGMPTLSQRFFQLDLYAGRHAYLADLPFYFKEKDAYVTLYIELLSKFIPKQLGYPELLIDKNVRLNTAILDYDYAKYREGRLIQQYGNKNFYTAINSYPFERDDFAFFEYDKHNILYYAFDENLELLIGQKKPSGIDYLASFSYIFIITSLLWFVIRFLLFGKYRLLFSHFNFHTRIKLALVFVVVISFVIIGVATLRFIVNVYNNKNNDSIREKAHSILVEFENEMLHLHDLTPDMSGFVKEQLVRLSQTFFTDINLYDRNGNLVASSREKIFNEGLISRKMNPQAFYNLTFNPQTFFVHNEKIGKLRYLSAYFPVYNIHNQCIAYVNLPYFARESEQRREIASFLAAFINIYVFLIALSIIIALLLSQYVSKPLLLIKEKLSRFEFGKRNEKIDWQTTDEIGNLVNEYNRLIDELERSADMLARSERESAWREMAKQVAHEIKNPLTPMKLSVQHLQKSWHDNPSMFEEKINSFTAMMVEQIDTLSEIASSFSDFAKMPATQNTAVDIKNVINSVLSVYEDVLEIPITINDARVTDFHVLADEKQLKRAFSNLVKNALQAVEFSEKPHVNINIDSEEDIFVITISDNGPGIPEEIAPKIFLPSFTTKSSGMGLGLAIVKNIIEGFNGHVYFESTKGVGTTFFVVLPRYRK